MEVSISPTVSWVWHMSTVLTEGRGRVASVGSFVVMWPQSQLHCVSLMDVSGKEAGVVLKKMSVLRLDLDLYLPREVSWPVSWT